MPPVAPAPPPERLLLGLGPATAQAGAALAQLRPGRRLCLAGLDEAAEVLSRGLTGTAFVLVDATSATVDGLLGIARAAAEGSPGLSLGVLYGRGPEQLQTVVKRLAAVAPVAPAGASQILFQASDQPVRLETARLAPVQGDTSKIAALVTAPAEIAFVVGHANAMHLSVGGVVLCRRSQAIAAPATAPEELSAYPCFHGDPCFFAPNRGEVEIGIERLRFKRAVVLSCFGVSPVGVTFAPALSIGDGLLQHAGIETLITTLRAAAIAEADLALTYFLCNAGLPLGAVANRANRRRRAAGGAAELFCFGDPESRLEATLAPAVCRREGDLLVVDPGALDGAADVVAPLPPGPLPADLVLLDETAGFVLSAAVEPDGFLYASVPAGWKGRPLRLRLADRGALEDGAGVARELMDDLGFLDLYLPLVGEANGDSAPWRKASDAHRALRDLLATWPLCEVPAGTRLEQRQLDALWRELDRRVEDLAGRFLALYTSLMVGDQRTHPTPWDSHFQTVEVEDGRVACAYCGHPLEERHTRARLGWARRSWGLCRDTCAYVYDGDPALGRWLEPPPGLTAGATAQIPLPTRNPYRRAVGAHAVAVLKHFEPGRSQAGLPVSAGLVPGEERSLALQLAVPDSFRPGIYHLTACLVVGAKCNFYRAQVQLARG